VNALFRKSWGIGTEYELCSARRKGSKAINWQVFVVEFRVISEKFICLGSVN